MFFKNSKQAKQARNPCNQHIVKYLHQKRISSYQLGHKQMFFVYGKAIQSVRNYILPIISQKQLISLKGIGQSIKNDLTRYIYQYYKEYRIQQRHMDQSTKLIQQKQQYKKQIINDQLSLLSQVGNASKDQFTNQPISLRDQLRENNVVRLLLKEDEQQQCKSEVVDRAYKPRAKSAAAYLLLAIFKLSQKGIDKCLKKQINDTIEQQLGQKPVKSWNTNINNLQRHKYIQLYKQNQQTFHRLTQKGKQFSIRLTEKTSMLKSKNKAINLVTEFKKNKEIKKQQMKSNEEIEFKQTIQFEEGRHQLFILIDIREIKTQVDRKFFQEKLTQKGVNCKVVTLSVGDFVFALKDNFIQENSKSSLNQFSVLNYVIQRKKADDLASSIVDGRYKQQRHRLKQSTIDNVFYIFQGNPSTNSALSQKQLETALLNTRVRGFKIVKTKNINQSAKFLIAGYEQILTNLKSGKKIEAIGSFHEYNLRNNKTKWVSVQDVFVQGIRCIPGVGKTSASKFIQYFSSFKEVHEKLKDLQSSEEKVVFLKELMKGNRIPKQFSSKLVEILFASQYDKEE